MQDEAPTSNVAAREHERDVSSLSHSLNRAWPSDNNVLSSTQAAPNVVSRDYSKTSGNSNNISMLLRKVSHMSKPGGTLDATKKAMVKELVLRNDAIIEEILIDDNDDGEQLNRYLALLQANKLKSNNPNESIGDVKLTDQQRKLLAQYKKAASEFRKAKESLQTCLQSSDSGVDMEEGDDSKAHGATTLQDKSEKGLGSKRDRPASMMKLTSFRDQNRTKKDEYEMNAAASLVAAAQQAQQAQQQASAQQQLQFQFSANNAARVPLFNAGTKQQNSQPQQGNPQIDYALMQAYQRHLATAGQLNTANLMFNNPPPLPTSLLQQQQHQQQQQAGFFQPNFSPTAINSDSNNGKPVSNEMKTFIASHEANMAAKRQQRLNDRKQKKSQRERERRQMINNLYEVLAGLLFGPLEKENKDRQSVLHESINHLHESHGIAIPPYEEKPGYIGGIICTSPGCQNIAPAGSKLCYVHSPNEGLNKDELNDTEEDRLAERRGKKSQREKQRRFNVNAYIERLGDMLGVKEIKDKTTVLNAMIDFLKLHPPTHQHTHIPNMMAQQPMFASNLLSRNIFQTSAAAPGLQQHLQAAAQLQQQQFQQQLQQMQQFNNNSNANKMNNNPADNSIDIKALAGSMANRFSTV